MQAALQAEGFAAGRHRIARLMRQAGLVARLRKRRHPLTTDSDHALPVAGNLLAHRFDVGEPDSKWVADTTYRPSGDPRLYLGVVEATTLAVVIDLFSRRVVGWGSLGQRPWSMAPDSADRTRADGSAGSTGQTLAL